MSSGQGSHLFFSDGGAGSLVAWYKLHRGGDEVLNSAADWVENGALRDMIRPWTVFRSSLHPRALPLLFDDRRGDTQRLDSLADCWSQRELFDCGRDPHSRRNVADSSIYVLTPF